MFQIRPGTGRLLSAALMAGLGLLLGLSHAPARAGETVAPTPFRVAFSSDMFTDVNENDAKASVKAWATSVARERGINVAAEPRIIKGLAELAAAFQSRSVDAAGITTAEYFALEPHVRWGTVFAATIGDDVTDSYLLLVHRESGFNRLADLAGRHLVIHRNPRTSLVDPWLGSLLVEARLPPATRFLGTTSATTRLSQAILPVFFRQADACVVTRRGFQTLAELNPQVGKELRVLAASPDLVATVFCFRAEFESTEMDRLMDVLRNFHRTAAGRQVLTVFQSDRLQEIPVTALAAARRLHDAGRLATARSPRKAAKAPALAEHDGRERP